MCLAFLVNNTHHRTLGALLLSGAINACSLQTYVPAPLDVNNKVTAYHQHKLSSPELSNFLKLNHASAPEQNQPWQLPALIQSALFLHPDLDLAKATYRATALEVAHGKQKPLPSISTQIARSNRANGDIDPFAMSLSIDLPVQTNDKQTINIAKLTHISELAKLDIAQTAWRIRTNVLQSALGLYQQQKEAALLNKTVTIHQDIVSMLIKRVSYGETDRTTLDTAERALQSAQQQLDTSHRSLATLRAKLAQSLGISANATANVLINHQTFEQALATHRLNDFSQVKTQRAAMINHLALRKALLQYAVAEQSLKLEYAKQIPDIVLSPGYAFEFGDSVWSLGFNSLMTLLHKNKVGIAKATQLRSNEVAQFEAIQHQVISTSQIALSEFQAANAQLIAHQNTIQSSKARHARLQKQFKAGLIDRLTLTEGKLHSIQVAQTTQSLEHQLLSSLIGLEAATQTSILTTDDPFQSIETLSQMDKDAL